MDDIIHECMRVPTPEYLRDQFAMAALTGLFADPSFNKYTDTTAALAYLMADAMLEARKSGGRP